jgi:hypothetical protein
MKILIENIWPNHNFEEAKKRQTNLKALINEKHMAKELRKQSLKDMFFVDLRAHYNNSLSIFS